MLTAAFTFATFSVIVGLGQMFVITLGPGNVDLSIPATITLAGAVATKVMDTQDRMILPGLLVALLIGVLVGCFNFLLILALRIPPIIATLSSSFLVQSTAIAYRPRPAHQAAAGCWPTSPPPSSTACRCSPPASSCSPRSWAWSCTAPSTAAG